MEGVSDMELWIKRIVSCLLIVVMLSNSFYFCIVTANNEKPKEKVKAVKTKEEENDILEEPEKEVVEQELVKEPEVVEEPEPEIDPMACIPPAHEYTGCLTKRGGVYRNPYTGLKETWYSQRVLPGGGLRIPGRHVNNEGFVCDEDGYICLASSTYAKGAIIETSRGMGKVYDCGCAPGIIDLYVDW